ncbi:MAG: aldose 1-epimerase family protein, partial [Clostridia bacterium]|nr:aldose 1-epimerase family protein [Clostridia bacterium]
MKNWIPDADRLQSVRCYGHMDQVARVKRYTLDEGKAAGVTACDVETGGGLSYTVLPGRGMDIAYAAYRGVPIAYISKAGIAGPGYHDPRDMQWLKSFFAGLLTTCGLGNAGPPCRETLPVLGDTPFGLHGDISNTGAAHICTEAEWQDDGRYRLRVAADMEEGRFHGEHLRLKREIISYLGERRLVLLDVFENIGTTPQPLMFFYHFNIGYPVLSEGSCFLAPSRRVWAETEVAKAGLPDYARYCAPEEGVLEQQFFHDLRADTHGMTVVALVNDRLELGVYLRFSTSELPCFAQWKVQRHGEYVHAFEPGICHPIGREAAGQDGSLVWLAPLERRLARL